MGRGRQQLVLPAALEQRRRRRATALDQAHGAIERVRSSLIQAIASQEVIDPDQGLRHPADVSAPVLGLIIGRCVKAYRRLSASVSEERLADLGESDRRNLELWRSFDEFTQRGADSSEPVLPANAETATEYALKEDPEVFGPFLSQALRVFLNQEIPAEEVDRLYELVGDEIKGRLGSGSYFDPKVIRNWIWELIYDTATQLSWPQPEVLEYT